MSTLIESDKYFNDPDYAAENGIEGPCYPTDINSAFVPTDKNDPDNIRLAQKLTRKRFNLR